jgi:hypothetical protein
MSLFSRFVGISEIKKIKFQYDNDKQKSFMSRRENDIDLFEIQNKYRDFENYRINKFKQEKQFENSFNSNSYSPVIPSSNNFINTNNFVNNIYNKMSDMKVKYIYFISC